MDPVASLLPNYQQHSWCRRTLTAIALVALVGIAPSWDRPCLAQDPIELWYWGTIDDFEDLDFTITNAYSGEQEIILGRYYVQNREFIGGESDRDSLYSFFGDAIFLSGVPLGGSITASSNGSGSTQMFHDIEIFHLTDGNNVLNFASTEIDYGDMEVYAPGGNDIIWTNIGDDLVYSDGGDDVVNTGPGDDVIHAGEGSDEIRGGLGSDQLFGESSADTLYFSTDNT